MKISHQLQEEGGEEGKEEEEKVGRGLCFVEMHNVVFFEVDLILIIFHRVQIFIIPYLTNTNLRLHIVVILSLMRDTIVN
jgi:hypothetical protein